MSIIDKVSAFLPWHERHPPESSSSGSDGPLSFRNDFDRWLGRALGSPLGYQAFDNSRWLPSVNVHETEEEVIVTAEVPGLDPDDLDLRITPTRLIIRGEKREESAQKHSDVAELQYGKFSRTVPLPPGLDADRADAHVRNSLLTVRFPKLSSPSGTKRIRVRT